MSGVKSFNEYQVLADVFESGKGWIGDGVLGVLLFAVFDELATEKTHVGIGFFPVILVTVRTLERLVRGVEGVARGVGSEKTFAALHVVEECLLALHRHRWIAIGAGAAEVSGRVEHHRVELGEILRREKGAVL
jgi:hypothetical protein